MKKFVKSLVLGCAALGSTAISAFAVAGPVETAVTTAVTSAQTAGEAVLGIAAGVLGAFLIFKFVKRAANKA